MGVKKTKIYSRRDIMQYFNWNFWTFIRVGGHIKNATGGRTMYFKYNLQILYGNRFWRRGGLACGKFVRAYTYLYLLMKLYHDPMNSSDLYARKFFERFFRDQKFNYNKIARIEKHRGPIVVLVIYKKPIRTIKIDDKPQPQEGLAPWEFYVGDLASK